MKTPIHHPSPGRIRLLWLALPLILAGCPQPPEEPPPPPPPPPQLPAPVEPCALDCELIITLPADPAEAPEVSDPHFNVVGGAEVKIVLVDEGNRPDQAATVLRFAPGQEAFVNPGGQPMQTVPLPQAGPHMWKVRDYADGVCTVQIDDEGVVQYDDDGCKYDVVNEGDAGRPELDPEVYIWP